VLCVLLANFEHVIYAVRGDLRRASPFASR
jgi:hypothetical protein